MTLSPDQITKILEGVPAVLDGQTLQVPRPDQFENSMPEFPLLRVNITSQGIPVSGPSLLGNYNKTVVIPGEDGEPDENRYLYIEIHGQQLRARMSAIIESKDLAELDRMSYDFYTQLCASELGINPICDWMQFRGADPPANMPSYVDNDRKKVYIKFIDFIVEYRHTWKKYFDAITRVEVEYADETYVRDFVNE